MADVEREIAAAEEEMLAIRKKLSDLRAAPVHLTQSEVNRYYEGFSNGVLWPLFHYQIDRVQRIDFLRVAAQRHHGVAHGR